MTDAERKALANKLEAQAMFDKERGSLMTPTTARLLREAAAALREPGCTNPLRSEIDCGALVRDNDALRARLTQPHPPRIIRPETGTEILKLSLCAIGLMLLGAVFCFWSVPRYPPEYYKPGPCGINFIQAQAFAREWAAKIVDPSPDEERILDMADMMYGGIGNDPRTGREICVRN